MMPTLPLLLAPLVVITTSDDATGDGKVSTTNKGTTYGLTYMYQENIYLGAYTTTRLTIASTL